jgi:hypothetical protein
MSHRAFVQFCAIALAATSLVGVASAGPGGGGGGHGGGGSHGGGGTFHGGGGGGIHGVGRAGAGRAFGGYYHGGYGGRGYYGRGYGRGWGWGGIGLGIYLSYLPWDYETYWWNGLPYYYTNDMYYIWDGNLGDYEAVDPPRGLSRVPPQGSVAPSPASRDLYAYPKNGQSEAQQKQDRDECRRWSTQQTGFDPTQRTAAAQEDIGDAQRAYMRAEAACLEGRNYSVR